MLKAVATINSKIIETQTGKPAKLAKKGTTTRTIQNTEAHLATLKLKAKLEIGKHLSAKYSVGDWKTFAKQYRVVPRDTDEHVTDRKASTSSASGNDDSFNGKVNHNSVSNSSDSSDDNKPKPGAWA